MTQRDKLIDRIRRRPVEADFSDVQSLLEHFGWVLDRETGSHVIFVKQGAFPINIPKKHGRKVKRHYLDEICKRLGLDEIDG